MSVIDREKSASLINKLMILYCAQLFSQIYVLQDIYNYKQDKTQLFKNLHKYIFL